jgi:hypothetical protein
LINESKTEIFTQVPAECGSCHAARFSHTNGTMMKMLAHGEASWPRSGDLETLVKDWKAL